jgi:hypothetical protein
MSDGEPQKSPRAFKPAPTTPKSGACAGEPVAETDMYSLSEVAAELVGGFAPSQSQASQDNIPPAEVLAVLQECGVQYMHTHGDVVNPHLPKAVIAKRRRSLSKRLSVKAPRMEDPDDSDEAVALLCGPGPTAAAPGVTETGMVHFRDMMKRCHRVLFSCFAYLSQSWLLGRERVWAAYSVLG